MIRFIPQRQFMFAAKAFILNRFCLDHLHRSNHLYGLARPRPCWTCIWRSIYAAASMPIIRSTSWAAVGPLPQPNA
jgi:hypothetical protein